MTNTLTIITFFFSLLSTITFANIDAGPDITYIVGSGSIDLNQRASTDQGTWTVTGGNLTGSQWELGYGSFSEAFVDFTATLTFDGQTDTKTIRAYNKLDPSIFEINTFSICENQSFYRATASVAPISQSFFIERFYQVQGSSEWVSYASEIKGSDLGPGQHQIRDRYINVVLPFVFTDHIQQLIVNPKPDVEWSVSFPQLCTSDPVLDLSLYLNTTNNVTLNANGDNGALSGFSFDPSISGPGAFQINAKQVTANCQIVMGLILKVVDPCN